MNKLLIAFMVFGSLFSSNLNKGPAQTPLQANDDPIVAPGNYLNLGVEHTDAIWTTKKNPERSQDSPQVRNPIIFFNANPEYEIDHIVHINYRVADADGRTYDGTVSYNKNFTSYYYTERVWSIFYDSYWVHRTKYNYQNDVFVKTYDNKLDHVTAEGWAAYTRIYDITYPEMGKVDVTIKKLYSLLGTIDDKIPERLLWQYKTSKEGFKDYQAFNKFTGYKNYKYYLILPLESMTDVTVHYLSLEAYDVNGNLITDKIDIETEPDFDSNPDDPNSTPLQDVSKFSFKKEDGKLKTTSAVYFPGSNKFRIVGLQMMTYESEDDKNHPVYVYGGDLVGKKTIELVVGVTREWKFVNTDFDMRFTTYEFQGKNNSLLIDIPLEVTDVQIDVYYQRFNIVEGEELEPFAFNLQDNDGNYGVRGRNAEDNDPNEIKPFNFWEWLKDLFSFDKDVGIFGSLKNILGTLLISLIVLAVFVLVVRLIRYRPRR